MGMYKQVQRKKQITPSQKMKTSTYKLIQPAGLYRKKSKYETSQKKHKEKLQQGKRKFGQQNKNNKTFVKATKTKM